MLDKLKHKGKVELKCFSKQADTCEFVYSVEHNNGNTSVEQEMTIKSQDGLFEPVWSASIEMSDFPTQDTPEKAAHKLAEWMERLAAAIRVGEIQPFARAEFKEITSRNK